ncbi:PEP-CTERM sorting domain-containing protein [Mariniblastus fucicola]|uniref:PEP-CTERM protein-sorting domain-containing protein n=1 Tax=Mariniblastus fucicola TaxID=980251 RepID=A0A5B9P9F1_9BACT|nr:PEP-CTERM sorting domain-containing protein [Mariniblastus fucicola]QEG21562.1 hypothetical protein MFFC18_14200 [Mariniblastus fucicola]
MKGRIQKLICFCAALTAFALAPSLSNADTLLIVDLTVDNEVTVTATAGLSDIDASDTDVTGIYFDNFYGVAGDALTATLVSGDLVSAGTTSDGSPELFRGGGGTDTGLNFWSWTNDATSTFTTGSVAFTGTATWTLDSVDYDDMVNGSSSGDLYYPADTSDDIAGLTPLGTYTVITAVPEPGALSVLGLVLGAGFLRRRR